MRKNLTEKGFTLVELAIVMVIIGLMIGAVLKGQAMIDDAKQKRMLTDLQGISAAYFMYYDRYSAIPGDDIANHGWSGVAVGGGNGYIGGNINNTNDGQEGHEAWQALRYIGLLSGDPAATGAAPAISYESSPNASSPESWPVPSQRSDEAAYCHTAYGSDHR